MVLDTLPSHSLPPEGLYRGWGWGTVQGLKACIIVERTQQLKLWVQPFELPIGSHCI